MTEKGKDSAPSSRFSIGSFCDEQLIYNAIGAISLKHIQKDASNITNENKRNNFAKQIARELRQIIVTKSIFKFSQFFLVRLF